MLKVLSEFLCSEDETEQIHAAFEAIILARVIEVPVTAGAECSACSGSLVRSKTSLGPLRKNTTSSVYADGQNGQIEWSDSETENESPERRERKKRAILQAARSQQQLQLLEAVGMGMGARGQMSQVDLTARGVSILAHHVAHASEQKAIVESASYMASIVHSRTGLAEAVIALDLIDTVKPLLDNADILIRNAAAVCIAHLSYNPTAHRMLIHACRNTPRLYEKILLGLKDPDQNPLALLSHKFIDIFAYCKAVGLPSESLEINGGPPVCGTSPSRSRIGLTDPYSKSNSFIREHSFARPKTTPALRGSSTSDRPTPVRLTTRFSAQEERHLYLQGPSGHSGGESSGEETLEESLRELSAAAAVQRIDSSAGTSAGTRTRTVPSKAHRARFPSNPNRIRSAPSGRTGPTEEEKTRPSQQRFPMITLNLHLQSRPGTARPLRAVASARRATAQPTATATATATAAAAAPVTTAPATEQAPNTDAADADAPAVAAALSAAADALDALQATAVPNPL